MAKELISFLFFVEPESEKIDAVYAFSPYGMTVRRDSDWFGTTRAESGINDKTGHIVYTLDWDKVPVPDGEVDFLDPEALQLYDRGELTLETLKEYADLMYDGTSQE